MLNNRMNFKGDGWCVGRTYLRHCWHDETQHVSLANIRSFWMITKSVLRYAIIRISEHWYLHNPQMIVDAVLATYQSDECSCQSRLQSKIKHLLSIRPRIASKVVLILKRMQNRDVMSKWNVVSPSMSIWGRSSYMEHFVILSQIDVMWDLR